MSAGRAESRFSFAIWLFLRLLAVVHLIAFASFWVQLDGLVGSDGILPAGRFFERVREDLGSEAWTALPSLCWLFGTGAFLHVLCALGVVFALLLFAGVAPVPCLIALWAGYLSLCSAGQIFMNFQWDALLLEATVMAAFVAPWRWLPLWTPQEPPRLGRLLVWWLLFRLIFLSGVVKLASGDERWRDLTALTFHYETQPLPTVLGWYLHQFPAWWHRASCAGMFTIELVAPFLLFATRGLRHNAALLIIALMAVVALTGNYTYFNLLTIALALTCLDNAFWRSILPARFVPEVPEDRATWPSEPEPQAAAGAATYVLEKRGSWRRHLAPAAAVFVFAYTTFASLPVVFRGWGAPPGFDALAGLVGPFRSLNTYGLFAVMTNPRPELVFEGSDDGREWRAYEFPHKPGSLTRRPTWVAPHQPRLDWQLWFAALGNPAYNRWVYSLCEHLLAGTPSVLALLERNPFPDRPPRHVRVLRYEYHFTDSAVRNATGQWWRRSPIDYYIPSASLR